MPTPDEIESIVERIGNRIERDLNRSLAVLNRQLTEDATIEGIALEFGNLSDEVVDEITDLHIEEIEDILGRFESTVGARVELTEDELQITEQLINDEVFTIANITEEVGIDLQGEISRQVILGDTPRIDQFVETELPRTINNIKTELNTAMLGFSRSVTFAKAKDLGIERFEYSGPVDKITRDFCRPLVGNTFTEAEIRAMDNGQGLDVRVHAGGWNCRHRWLPVADDV